MEGYHSPQLDVKVRLNTNESPYPPPAAWLDAYSRELRDLEYHRYPDRGAHELRDAIGELHGFDGAHVFAANGSNEVLQSLCLAYGGAGRAVAVFEPTYALHSHIARITGTAVAVGARDAGFRLDLDEAERVLREISPAITFLCSPNNPTGMVEPDALVEGVLAVAPGLVVVDEAYGQFAPRSHIGAVSDGAPLVVTRTFSKTWSLAALRLGYCIAPPEVVRTLEQVALPYHLDAAKQIAGRLALRFLADMEARVAALVEERGRLAAALAELAVDVWPSGANFVLFRPRPVEAQVVWQRLVDRSVLVRNCASWPALGGLPARHGRLARRERRLPERNERGAVLTSSRSRRATVSRRTKETAIDIDLDVDGSGAVDVTTGLPFFDHMVGQLGKHGGFDLRVRAEGDLDVDAHHTVEDVGIALGQALAEALGDKAGIRRFASLSLPLDEALVDVALDLSGRPFLHHDVEAGREPLGTPPFDPQLAEEFWRAFATVGRDHVAPAPAQRQEPPSHPRGRVQGRSPLLARRGAHRGRRRALHQGHVVMASSR